MVRIIKYAILDTDFVSKTNIIHNKGAVLADELLSFPDYVFFCHQKMADELSVHGSEGTNKWLNEKVNNGKIVLYDDKRIIDELKQQIGSKCYNYYCSFLRQGCDIFDKQFYEKFFCQLDGLLSEAEENNINSSCFLKQLVNCERRIGHQQNLGEIKAFVLSQALKFLYDAVETCIFCSDDFDARRGFANAGLMKCVSFIAIFYKFWRMGKMKEEVSPYYQNFVKWCSERKNPQTHLKVWIKKEGAYKREPVDIKTLFDDIFDGKYQVRMDGDLQKICR